VGFFRVFLFFFVLVGLTVVFFFVLTIVSFFLRLLLPPFSLSFAE